jgi:hypothetical protein
VTSARPALLSLGVIVAIAAGALAQADFGFMPDGGKQTLRRLVAAGRLNLGEIVGRKASEEDWTTALRAAYASLDTETTATLASYLAINLPAPTDGEPSPDVLPPDGKQLAIENCQFCHSFFTGYLVHDRDAEGWRAIFKSPFHRELPMTPIQRETFARYSAINMPVPIDKVPEDLRF